MTASTEPPSNPALGVRALRESARVDPIAFAKQMEQDSWQQAERHATAAGFWGNIQWVAGGLAAVLAAAASASAFSDNATVAGLLALGATASAALVTALRPGDISSQHIRAAAAYNALQGTARELWQFGMEKDSADGRDALRALTTTWVRGDDWQPACAAATHKEGDKADRPKHELLPFSVGMSQDVPALWGVRTNLWLEVGRAVRVVLARGVRRKVAEVVEPGFREQLRVRGEIRDQVMTPGRCVQLVLGLNRLGDTAGGGSCRGRHEDGRRKGGCHCEREGLGRGGHLLHLPGHAGAAVGSAPIWDMIVNRSQYCVISVTFPSRTRIRSHAANLTLRPLAGTPAKSPCWVPV